MPWRCVYETATGRAISFGTDVDAPLLPGQSAKEVDGPPTETLMWEPNGKRMINRPAKLPRKRICKD